MEMRIRKNIKIFINRRMRKDSKRVVVVDPVIRAEALEIINKIYGWVKIQVDKWKVKHLNAEYFFKIKEFNSQEWVPQAREAAVLINDPGTLSLYLFGGVSKEPLGGLLKLLIYNPNFNLCRWDLVRPDHKIELPRKYKGTAGMQGLHHKGKFYCFFGYEMEEKVVSDKYKVPYAF